MVKLLELAEVAHRRMATMSLEEKKLLLEPHDVRVHVSAYDPPAGVIDERLGSDDRQT